MPLFWLGMIDQLGTLPRIMGGPISPNHPEWRFHAATMGRIHRGRTIKTT
jgi:hypothetical protein